MVTSIGLNPDFNVVLKSLISLDFDAVEAYEAAISRLENSEYKNQLSLFRQDHIRHTQELSDLARKLGVEPPTGPDMKQLLTKGKVVMADMLGDKAILMAMKTNEEDTNTAYERASGHKNLPVEARSVIERGLADERRHRSWIVNTLSQLTHKAA
jgi:uncharacterized protein (TIGR02284 family)